MKSYDEMADRILEKYNARLEQRKKRRAVIFRTAVGCSGLCAAAVIGLSVWNNDSLKKDLEKGASESIITEADVNVTTAVSSGENVFTTYTTSVSVDDINVTALTTSYSAAADSTSVTAAVTGNAPSISIITTNAPGKTASASIAERPASVVTTKVSSTVVTTQASAPVVTVTTTEASPDAAEPDFVFERSLYMKKLPAFLAALIASVSVSPVVPNAADAEIPVPIITPDTIMEEYSVERNCVAAIADGQFDIDLNSDGKFDIFDCYALYRSVWNAGASDEMREKCRLNADYDENGIVDPNDCEYLAYYYGLYKDITTDLYVPEYYKENCPDTYGSAQGLVDILKDYYEDITNPDSENYNYYYTLTDTYDFNFVNVESRIDPLRNSNGNGKPKRMGSYGCNSLSEYDTIEEYGDFDRVFVDFFFSEMHYLRANYKLIKNSFDSGKVDLDVDADGDLTMRDIFYIMVYVENNNGEFTWNENWTDKDGALHRGPLVTHYEMMAELPEDIEQRCVKMVNDYLALFNNNELAGEFMVDKFNWVFSDYMMAYFFENKPLLPEYAKVTIDDNGDYHDYFKEICKNASNYGVREMVCKYMEDAGITEASFTFNESLFAKYFTDFVKAAKAGEKEIPDINFDGKYDYWDSVDVELYIGELFGGKTVDSGRTLSDEVIEKCKTDFDLNGDGVSGDLYDAMIAECYYLYIGVPEEGNSTSENVEYKFDKYYELIEKTDIERSGDADGDKIMKMNDAVLIMQSISNGDKYQLTSKGKFNADLYNTGDGITPMDALELQNKLLKK